MTLPTAPGPIGVFDSGYGGLTILDRIRRLLPAYDYLYLGDNARAPYGAHSFRVVYQYTLQAVKALFAHGCHLVILACNTASAKALRTIQQNDLPMLDAGRRVLGVIRPTAEIAGQLTHTRHIGVLATAGTILSGSYQMEIAKLYPDITVNGEACPMWVPLVENDEASSPGADYFVQKYISRILERDSLIDTLLLGCTHYPILLPKIRRFTPPQVHIVPQGDYVAAALQNYLIRHPEIAACCTQGGNCRFLTTEEAGKFAESASFFLNSHVEAQRINL